MKALAEIPSFPVKSARILETRYGIATAESFYEHAVREPGGMRTALGIETKADFDRLVKLVEGQLSPKFVHVAKSPPVRHPRGALDPAKPSRDR